MLSFHGAELFQFCHISPPQTMALHALLSGVEVAPLEQWTQQLSILPLCSSSGFPERMDSWSDRTAANGSLFILVYLHRAQPVIQGSYMEMWSLDVPSTSPYEEIESRKAPQRFLEKSTQPHKQKWVLPGQDCAQQSIGNCWVWPTRTRVDSCLNKGTDSNYFRLCGP